MRSLAIALVLFVASIGCRNSPDRNTTVSTATLPALPPSPQTPQAPQTQVGPGWHWVNPTPQGNALWSVVANPECGIVAAGEESTVMRSTDDGATWTTHQSDDRWRFKSAALFGTTLYAVGDGSNGSVLVSIANCGDGEQKTIRKLDTKTDGSANAVAVDAQGRIFLTTVLHAHGKILCSKPGETDLAVCDDLPNQPFYGLFIDKSGRVFAAGGYQGALGGIVRRSSDHGATWKTVGQHLGSIAYGIWGDADGKRLFATGSSSLYSSSDGGVSWITTPVPIARGGSMMLGTGDAPYVPNDFSTFVFGSADTGTFFVAGG
ncbi:MAG: WD40/YVTN/BNR-like repeat-containing protein, partial [Polyangiaceae bacterium]